MKSIFQYERHGLNTGSCLISPGWGCSADAIETAAGFLGQEAVQVPTASGVELFLTETPADGLAFATFHVRAGEKAAVIGSWWTVWDRNISEKSWNHILKIRPAITERFSVPEYPPEKWHPVRNIDLPCPQTTPWCAALFLPGLMLAPQLAPELGRIECAMVWAQLKRAGMRIFAGTSAGHPEWN